MRKRRLTSSIFVLLGFLFLIVIPAIVLAGSQKSFEDKRGICDHKFGREGNYIQITTSTAGTKSSQIFVCFGRHKQRYNLNPVYYRPEFRHYDDDPSTGVDDAGCIRLFDLEGRYRSVSSNSWSNWKTGLKMTNSNHVYQFALCSKELWENFFKFLEPEAWNHIRIYTESSDGIQISGIKIVQNRVIVFEEDALNILLDRYHCRQIDLSWRIAQYKNDKITSKVTWWVPKRGLPWDDPANWHVNASNRYMPSTIAIAAQDLGHSGARKYNRVDKAWCSEFALYVIENGAHLSNICPDMPDGLIHGDFSIKTVHDWFAKCEGGSRVIKKIKKKAHLMRPGYYLSIGWVPAKKEGHSVIFVGWADGDGDGIIDPGKWYWEISGNNQCRPEKEVYNPNYMSNFVCVALRNWNDLNNKDFAANTY